MTISSERDLIGLSRIGRICGEALRLMAAHLEPGITTRELDEIGAAYLAQHGARSAPQMTYNFPAVTCISLNDEAAHGIPGERVLQSGDLVNIDVSAELDGYYADTGASFPVGRVSKPARDLLAAAKAALADSLAIARAGQPINAIGRAMERRAKRGGFSTIRELTAGHGVGRGLHEPPEVLGFYHKHATTPLHEGLVLTIEPFLSTGSGRIYEADDGWTLRTTDGGLVAQYEHTVVITRGKPLLLTAVQAHG